MYNLLKSLFIFTVIIAVSGCSSSRNDKGDDTENHRQSIPKLGKSLAPETVLVNATLVKYEDSETYYSCVLNLDKVLAYGPATSPLAEGSKIKVEIDKDLIKNIFPSIETMFQSNRLFTMTLKKNKGGLGLEIQKQIIWRVVKIE